MRPPSAIIPVIARRMASARPILGSTFSASNALVMSDTVASLSTDQCDTNGARAAA